MLIKIIFNIITLKNRFFSLIQISASGYLLPSWRNWWHSKLSSFCLYDVNFFHLSSSPSLGSPALKCRHISDTRPRAIMYWRQIHYAFPLSVCTFKLINPFLSIMRGDFPSLWAILLAELNNFRLCLFYSKHFARFFLAIRREFFLKANSFHPFLLSVYVYLLLYAFHLPI